MIAANSKVRRLSRDELAQLGRTMLAMEREGEHPTALAAIRAMLLTGFRRTEMLGLHREWVRAKEHCVCFPETKTGGQVRIIGQAAIDLLEALPIQEDSPFLFPADWGDGHFIGVVRVLDRVCAEAKLQDITPHVLRRTFASMAAELGCTEMTIAGLLGHASRGVTQRYVHLGSALMPVADRIAEEIARLVMPSPMKRVRTAAE